MRSLICCLFLLCACQQEQVDYANKFYNDQKELLRSSKVIVCYPYNKQSFGRYADWDTRLCCITHNKQVVGATLEEIYSWGFKIAQIVDVPQLVGPNKNVAVTLYYFDKRW